MNRLSIFAAAVLLCAPLFADNINYREKGEPKGDFNARVSAWSWKQVEYTTEGEAKKTIGRADLVSVQRTAEGGTMSENVANGVSNKTSDPASAKQFLEAEIASPSSPVDKEEAMFRLGEVWVLEAESNIRITNLPAKAIEKMQAYMKAYPQGFFIDEAHLLLARVQVLGKDLNGARSTYRDMARLGFGRDVQAYQSLGEMELNQRQYDNGITAFKDAAKAAGNNRMDKHRANAYLGMCMVQKKDFAGAKPILEEIINDKDKVFDNDASGEDELVLSVAYPAYGDCLFDAKNFKDAYDAYMKGAWVSWWAGGRYEAHCLGQAWRCAKALNIGNDKVWKPRQDKLEEALQAGFPTEWKRVKDLK